ncbi:MAG: hypothetical protein H6577_21260 [Lewinellaceae bacterium]|nr:hypothetical protein [Saprospiraceae bacterium]MCB9340660.1 hypothetical protein [Lewinellaceae bacterium]
MQTTSQKVKKTSRSKIDSLEHFKQEFAALLSRFDQEIANSAQYERVEMDGPSNDLINDLNRLKLHRSKLKDMLLSFENATAEEWVSIRPMARKVYEKAIEARSKINKEVARKKATAGIIR